MRADLAWWFASAEWELCGKSAECRCGSVPESCGTGGVVLTGTWLKNESKCVCIVGLCPTWTSAEPCSAAKLCARDTLHGESNATKKQIARF